MTNIKEIKEAMGIGSCLHIEKRRFVLNHPQNDTDMCYVVGIPNPLHYSEVKERGISDDRISYYQDYVSWLEERNAYLETEMKKIQEKNKVFLSY